MAADETEEELLRSVALKNAKSILRARQRAERELIDAKEAPFSGDDARDFGIYNRRNSGD